MSLSMCPGRRRSRFRPGKRPHLPRSVSRCKMLVLVSLPKNLHCSLRSLCVSSAIWPGQHVGRGWDSIFVNAWWRRWRDVSGLRVRVDRGRGAAFVWLCLLFLLVGGDGGLYEFAFFENVLDAG